MEKDCEQWLGEIKDTIKIISPTISLINTIETPQNSLIKNTLEVVDSGANIHLEKKSTLEISLVKM